MEAGGERSVLGRTESLLSVCLRRGPSAARGEKRVAKLQPPFHSLNLPAQLLPPPRKRQAAAKAAVTAAASLGLETVPERSVPELFLAAAACVSIRSKRVSSQRWRPSQRLWRSGSASAHCSFPTARSASSACALLRGICLAQASLPQAEQQLESPEAARGFR